MENTCKSGQLDYQASYIVKTITYYTNGCSTIVRSYHNHKLLWYLSYWFPAKLCTIMIHCLQIALNARTMHHKDEWEMNSNNLSLVVPPLLYILVQLDYSSLILFMVPLFRTPSIGFSPIVTNSPIPAFFDRFIPAFVSQMAWEYNNTNTLLW